MRGINRGRKKKFNMKNNKTNHISALNQSITVKFIQSFFKTRSLDVYIQPQNPGQAKQNNWLPSPTTNQPFNMVLRLYWPDQPQALNGTWSPPPIQRANATG